MMINGHDPVGTASRGAIVANDKRSMAAPAETDAGDKPKFRALTGELVVRLAAQGAPVDQTLVTEIRDALGRGEYPVDARKIAAAMIALDLDGGR